MKKIEAILLEEQVQAVKDALESAGFVGMTIYPVKGRGAEGGIELDWRATTYTVDFLPKVMVMMVVEDVDCQRAVDLITKTCQSPEFHPDGAQEYFQSWGKIIVSPVEQMVSIRNASSILFKR